MTIALPITAPRPPLPTSDDRLHAVAQKLEASFLSEMLKSAGLDSAAGAFGGGIGEDLFQSYLREAQATEMARAGGIGLAESIFHALRARGA
ncbi:MAG: hypothetical protein GC146_08900 [Limimaricola sp.]|uniref:rod-binding protein n=1 Tax=Limimaricola sp. TaxID=2211665 RepID=UPI001D58142E|nr:rod-binding protein [Limimaricola sp.]MBI1417326.1 hypothetical protein [Limimaricola sp.]